MPASQIALVRTDREPQDYELLLARVKKALDSAVDISVPVHEIRPYVGQPREYFSPESIQRLSVSIDTGGQMTRGMIREKPGKTRFELIDGERRWRSINLIPIERRPLYKAQIIDADDDVVQFLISGIVNFNREGHTPLEVMRTIQTYRSFKIPMDQIAGLLGISSAWATSIHGLKDLSPDVMKLLDPMLPRAKQLPVVAAMQIAKLPQKHQIGLAMRVITKDISVGRVRGEVVKVANHTNSNIRVREASPTQQWRSLNNQIGVIGRTVNQIETIVLKGDVSDTLCFQQKTTTELLRTLKKARETIEKTEARIARIRDSAAKS